jgi:hypothetical protein
MRHFALRVLPIVLAASATLTLACDNTLDPSRRPQAARFSRSPEATELGYYSGSLYRWQFPSGTSDNQNELVLPDCFRVGPDFTRHNGPTPSGRLYAIFLPGATLHSCPDGSDLHDHLLSAVSGTAGYSTFWDLVEVWPDVNFDPAIMPITSEEALDDAVAKHQVFLIDDEITLHAVVLGPAQ